MGIFVIFGIFKYLLYSILGLLIYTELNQIYHMIRWYRKGVDVMYFPVIGFIFYQLCQKKNKDTSRWMKERVRSNDLKGKRAIAWNYPLFSRPALFVQDPEMINEILMKEMDICYRKEASSSVKLFDLGTFYDFSERATAIRGAFTEVFRAENMSSMAPKIQRIVNEVLDSIEKNNENKKQIESKGFMDVELRPKISEIFMKILEEVLFGVDLDTLVEGKPLASKIIQIFQDINKVFLSAWTLLTFGLGIYTRLDPRVKEIDRLMAKIKQKIMELYNLKKEDPDVKANNFLGGIIHYNRKHPEDGLNEREITGNVLMMVFAAFDTSRHATGWAMRFLSIYQNEQKALRTEAEKLGTFANELDGEILEAGPELNAWMKETMRLGAPFVSSNTREFFKDTKIKGIQFEKGDLLNMNLLYNHFKEKEFPDAYRFDRMRHYKAKYHRNNLMPFGGGKRGCIGRYLAIMNIKIIVLSFMRRFSVESDPGFEPQNWHIPFHTLEKVIVRLRKL